MAPHAARMTGWSARLGPAVLAALLTASLPAPCPAQAAGSDVKYTNRTSFWIPFEPEGAVQRLREVQLYYSGDQGRTWRFIQSANPNQRGFQFQGGRDGTYWFTVRTVDVDNRAFPATVEGAQPQLVVCIDTRPPAVRLAPLAPQDGAGVEWDIQDEHLDASTLRLEWRGPGSPAWQAMPSVEAAAAGRRAWQAGVAVEEVRLQVRDKAGNLGEGHTSMSGRRSDNPTYPAESPGPGGANRPPVRLVNSNRISINYKVEDIGPSKATLDLWWTRNQGRLWEKCQENLGTQGPVVVPAPQEGLYGFTLVARSGVNLGDRPPQPGDPPQIWVEVDLTPPKVQLSPPEVGRGLDANKMTLRWAAADKHLDERPVKLEYAPVTQENATEPAGAWQEIEANLPPDGQYVWVVPPEGVRYFVRAVVKDRAGNAGEARTPRPVVVDLSRPRGNITDVEPVRGEGGTAPQNSINISPRGGGNFP